MQLEKLKLKEKEVKIFKMNEELKQNIAEKFIVTETNNQVLSVIIKEKELWELNDFIDALDFTNDFLMWVLYPKGTSKKYKGITEIKRDDIRTKINDKVKTVAMVSLDEDWSAIRLRNRKFSK